MRLPFSAVIAPTLLVAPFTNAESSLNSLLEMSLVSLTDTKVISATRTAQSLADTAAAVYVITAKEINRSGARSVADALALAPGLHVAKYSNYDWGVTARGQNQALNNTLMVMVDGRSVFNPMFSGVDWDLIPVSMDNIEQIEVVLGPVGTIWGGNAVNGVINIITFEAENAPNGKVAINEGNYHYSEYKLHDSTAVGDYGYLSGYFEFVDHMPWTSTEDRVQPVQDYNVYTERFGARFDYQKFAHTLSIQAGGIRSREDYQWLKYNPHFLFPGQPDTEMYDTEMTMQEYFSGLQHIYDKENGDSWDNKLWLTYSSNDGTDRDAKFWRLDLDSHYTMNDLWGTQLSIGGNARIIKEKLGTYSIAERYSMPYVRVTDEASFLNQSYGIYANWNIDISNDTKLTLGNRWQYNNLTHGIEPQPQVRVSHELSNNQRLWAGWGRAVVTPSRLEQETTFQENYYVESGAFDDAGNQYDYIASYLYRGNENLNIETVETYELGYRVWDDNTMQLSLSGYYSVHDNIRAAKNVSAQGWIITGNSSPGTVGTYIEQYISEYIDPLWSETMGGEVALKWQPLDQLQLNANYSYKRIVGHCEGAICSSNNAVKRQLENQPNHFVNAQVMWDITPQWWVSSTMHYVSESTLHEDFLDDPSYIWPKVLSFDASLSWQFAKYAPRITASAENLGADQSKEYPDNLRPYNNGTQYWLSVEWNYASVNWSE
ncbi:TonB-dependent receptor [Vibrio alfacsensis]|uniref:TonB-dependent receptor n=1 Tax=Vibrio alfacsensis TaxID=1074311 RepID=A0ABM6YYT7_9VIBR|nr:TonB-dependent receptor [Vibrio alfacsensis]AXY03085.1 TonB-dependent receptor [Vibrio alfacsensis]